MGKRKTCPFCGGSNLAEGAMLDGGPVIVCRDCDASGPEGSNKRDAAYKWNHRAEEGSDA